MEDNAPLCFFFQRCYVHSHVQCGTGILLTVDQVILIKGDRMYLNAFESQSIPDTDTLSLVYLPNQARWTDQSPVDVTKSPAEGNNAN